MRDAEQAKLSARVYLTEGVGLDELLGGIPPEE